MTHGKRADVTAKELAAKLRARISNHGRQITVSDNIAAEVSQAADELDRLAGEVERLKKGLEQNAVTQSWSDFALRNSDN